jgi:hypothetical protein
MNVRARVRSGVLLAPLALLLVLSFDVAPAGAGLGIACPAPTTQAFARWSDPAHYALAPDGGFEAGGSGWTFTGGARVGGGNESFFLRGRGDARSLVMPAGSTATTPPMCIGLGSSKMRFVVAGAAGSAVKVQIVYRGVVSSVLGILDGGVVRTSGGWSPSPAISMLGGVAPLLTQSVQFRLVATAGSPQVDDVYLDPWKLG